MSSKFFFQVRPASNGFTVTHTDEGEGQSRDVVFESFGKMIRFMRDHFMRGPMNRFMSMDSEACESIFPEEMRDELGVLRQWKKSAEVTGKELRERMERAVDIATKAETRAERLATDNSEHISTIARLQASIKNMKKRRKR